MSKVGLLKHCTYHVTLVTLRLQYHTTKYFEISMYIRLWNQCGGGSEHRTRATLQWQPRVKAHLCSTLNTDPDMDGAFCPCSAFISSVFLHVSRKLMDTDQTEQYHRKPWGAGGVAVTTRYVALVRHEEEITMAELFEERLCELVRNFNHLTHAPVFMLLA